LRCIRGCRAGGPLTDSTEARALREQRVGSELQQVAGPPTAALQRDSATWSHTVGFGGENHVRACFP
jgi:hypothetical protein